MITKRDRYRGALVGVLAGDALLAPYETWPGDEVQLDMNSRGGLVPHDYPNPWREGKMMPMGRPTDDSDQTAALAESLIANRGLNEEDLFKRLRRVTFDHVSPLWDGRAVGAGQTTRNALRFATFAESQARSREGAFPSNGSLMRAAPLALYFGSFDKIEAEIIRRMSEVTHFHPHATSCCTFYVGMLLGLLEGVDFTEVQGKAIRLLTYDEMAEMIVRMSVPPFDPGKWPGRGAATLTLDIAVHTLRQAIDFRDGLIRVAMIGGDTDTYGAVAGGLLGAKFGLEGIPQDWQAILKGRDKMIEYADALYEMSHTS